MVQATSGLVITTTNFKDPPQMMAEDNSGNLQVAVHSVNRLAEETSNTNCTPAHIFLTTTKSLLIR